MKVLSLLFFLSWVLPIHGQSQCTVTHYDEFSGMAQWYVTQIVQDKQGIIWFATWNGLDRYDGYTFESFKSHAGDGLDMASDRIQDMMLMDDGNLLCLVEGRCFLFNVSTCKFVSIPTVKEHKYQQMMSSRFGNKKSGLPLADMHYRDHFGTNWIIKNDGSLSFWDSAKGKQVTYFSSGDQMSDVYFSTIDKNGNVWLRSRYGAYRLSFYQRPYQMFSQEKPSLMRCAMLDAKQRYWLTTKEDATVRLYDKDNHLLGYLGRDGHLYQNYTSFGSPIYSIIQDTKGFFWFGSKPDGLFRLKEISDRFFSVEHFQHDEQNKNSLSNNNIFDIKEDGKGRLWIATFDKGINCLPFPHEKQLVFWHQLNGLVCPKDSFLRVRHIYITKDQKLLAATTSGLLVADILQGNVSKIRFKGHVKDAKRSNSLINNATMYVTEDAKHRIFVCTESGGVNQILSKDLMADHLEFKHFNRSSGLPSDVALSAIPFGKKLLVVSNNQLILLDPDKQANHNCEAYLWKERLRFSDATPLKLPDGRYLFGLQNGAFTIKKMNLIKSSYVPPIALTGLSVNNGPLDLTVNMKDTLIFLPKQRNIFLQFAALDYTADGNIDYAFRLGGDNMPWNSIGKNHSITLLDLDPGVYLLQIRSTNGDGVWVDNTRTLTLIVKPTFWETRWAKILYLILFALIVGGILKTRRYIFSLKRRQKELHEAYLALLNTDHDRIMLNSQSHQSIESKIKPEDELFMKRVMKFIEEQIGNSNISIGDMAEATATSRSGLNRKMKSILGVTPLDFIREARIRKACQLLKEGGTVNDVAYKCGFSDPKYFGKCFKAGVGMTPTEYKAENSAI